MPHNFPQRHGNDCMASVSPKSTSNKQIGGQYLRNRLIMISAPSIIYALVAVVQFTSARLSSDTPRNTSRALEAEIRDVCIAGGGPSGTYAAHLLEQKGYSVALFDEASRLGGKTVPFQNGDDSFFRHIVTSDMRLVSKFIEQYGMEGYKIERKNRNLISDQPPYTVTPVSRENRWEDMLLPPEPGLNLEVAAAAMRYISVWEDYESAITQPNHHAVPKELMMPADEFLHQNDMIALAELPLFYNGLSNYGYGFLNQVPIISIMKYVTPEKISAGATDNMIWFPFHKIFERMGSGLSDLHLNTKVEHISQESHEEIWSLHAKALNDELISYKCDKVVLAFPPTAEALSIVEGLDQETKDLFSDNIRHVNYWEVILSDLPFCRSRDYRKCLAPQNSYVKSPDASNTLTPSMNVPNTFWVSEGSQARVLFNGGDQFSDQESVFDIIRGYLHAAFDYEPDSYNIELYKKWSYFPHVSPDGMSNGFFGKAEEAQGRQNLFFTGGWRDFELVDNSMRTTEDLLNRHFAWESKE